MNANASTPTAGSPLTQMPGELDQPVKKSRRKGILIVVIILAALVGGYFLNGWWTHGRFVVSTDDAYIQADISTLSSRVAGHIISLAVTENQSVNAGDVLLTIDDGDYRLAVESAREKIDTQSAAINRLERQSAQQLAIIDQSRAQLAAVRADATRSEGDFVRAEKLAESDFSSRARLDQARADRDRASASVRSAEAGLAAAEAGIDVILAQKVEIEKMRLELMTALAKAERDLSFTTIKAPFAGIVGNLAAQKGQLVQAGTRLLALVPSDAVYVDANFKETQISRIKIGQTAQLHIDALPGQTIHGTVASFAPASGAEFSLLPPENATGNFTKIVQRVPVRITIDPAVVKEGFLRPGLSVTAEVDTAER